MLADEERGWRASPSVEHNEFEVRHELGEGFCYTGASESLTGTAPYRREVSQGLPFCAQLTAPYTPTHARSTLRPEPPCSEVAAHGGHVAVAETAVRSGQLRRQAALDRSEATFDSLQSRCAVWTDLLPV